MQLPLEPQKGFIILFYVVLLPKTCEHTLLLEN